MNDNFQSRRIAIQSGAVAAVLLATTSSFAVAQESPSEALDTAGEIVVTATRQSEFLSKVPLSVAAYSQERLDAQGVRNISDISRLTPGLNLSALGSQDVAGGSKTISIRGIASNVGSATTGVYLDDTPIQTRALGNVSSNVYPQVFDLERVEVLRGPQGTLFGAGAEGGVVRFITPRPNVERTSIYARSEFAVTRNGAPSYEAGAALSGPIEVDQLAFRASAWFRRDGGYIDRVDPDDGSTVDANANGQDSFAVRGALQWRPSDRFSALAAFFHQDEDVGDTSTYFTSYSDMAGHDFNAARKVASTSHDRVSLPTLTLEYSGDDYEIISTTSYFRRKVDRTVDYSNFVGSLILGDPFGYQSGEYSFAYLNDAQRDWTQEIRLQARISESVALTFGGFYSRSIQTTFQYNVDPDINTALARLGAGPIPLLDDISLFSTEARSKDVQKAVFGQLTWEIVADLKASAGIRYAKVTSAARRVSTGPVAGSGVNFDDRISEEPVTPKFGLSYQLSPQTLLYASAAKGYRIGGVNGPQLTLCDDEIAALGLDAQPDTYSSDSLWSYEGGVKTRFGAVRLEASVFDIYWKNIQRQISLPTCGASFVANFSDARSTGFDLQVEVSPAPGFSLGGSVGYANARLTSDVIAEAGGVTTAYGFSGDKIGGPPWSWTGFAEYESPVSDRASVFGRIDYQHIGQGADINYAVFGTDPAVRPSEAYDQISLRAGYRVSGFEVAAFVNNLLDEKPILYRSRYTTAFDTFFQESTLRPRTVGITASYRY